MRTSLNLIVALLLAAPVTALGQVVMQIHSEDTAEEMPRFADLDGDGIDDNARDRDFDGIPDAFMAGADEAAEENSPELLLADQMDAGLGMENAFDQPADDANHESNADAYSSREFAARDLKEDRGGFDSDADPEKEASRGKTCIGGICF
jgi:hypothetical protein